MQIVAMMLALLACGVLPGGAIAHGSAHHREQVRAHARDARESHAPDRHAQGTHAQLGHAQESHAHVTPAHVHDDMESAADAAIAIALPDADHHHDIRLSVSSARLDVPVLSPVVVHAILIAPVVSIPTLPPVDRDDQRGGNATRGPPPRLRAPPSLV